MQVRHQATHQDEELTIRDVEKDAVGSQCFLELFVDVFVGAAAEKEGCLAAQCGVRGEVHRRDRDKKTREEEGPQ